MKKEYFVAILIFSLGFSLVGCKSAPEAVPTDGILQDEVQESVKSETYESEVASDQVEETDIPEPERETDTDVTQGGPYGRISISLPEGWGFTLCPMDSEELLSGQYGILFYPEGAEEGYVELVYQKPFGVCGTGLSSETATIAGNPVNIGTYDGHEHWDFISFQGDYEGIVALTNSVEVWWSEYSEQVLDILNTLSFLPQEREGGAYIYHEESELEALGLSFSLKNISSTGAMLVFNQYDPDAPTGELEFGNDFELEALKDGKWESVPIALEGNYGFNAIAYVITDGECLEKELDWEWLYGELAAGEYRIKKEIHDFRGTGDFDQYDIYAHFVLN